MACYKLEMASTSCRSLEVSTTSTSLVQSNEVHLSTGDTYHLSLTSLTDQRSVLCFQSGLSIWICRVLIASGLSISLGPELSVRGTLSGLAITAISASQLVVCAALSDQHRATSCHLMSVSTTEPWLQFSCTFFANSQAFWKLDHCICQTNHW